MNEEKPAGEAKPTIPDAQIADLQRLNENGSVDDCEKLVQSIDAQIQDLRRFKRAAHQLLESKIRAAELQRVRRLPADYPAHQVIGGKA